jgi:hypothetical protein
MRMEEEEVVEHFLFSYFFELPFMVRNTNIFIELSRYEAKEQKPGASEQ